MNVCVSSPCSAFLHDDVLVSVVWVLVAQYSSPRSVCNLEQLNKPIHAALKRAAKGSLPLARYWHAQCYRLRWDADDAHGTALSCSSSTRDAAEAAKRRFLQYALTKQEARKDWKAEYQEEYMAFLRRNVRGINAVYQCGIRREPTVIANPNIPSELRASTSANQRVAPDVDEVLLRRDKLGDGDFARLCLDGGVSIDHFRSNPGASCDGTPNRQQYGKDSKLGKRKGKHARGKEALWTAWVAE